jgi:hypothetical protein
MFTYVTKTQIPTPEAEQENVILRHLSEMEVRFNSTMKKMQESMDTKIETIEKKLYNIAEGFAEGFDRVENDMAKEEAEDRKRLKERLKEALDEGKRILRTSTDLKSDGWLEFIFGICKPDGRIGKAGSRFVPRLRFCKLRVFLIYHFLRLIHPQSRFIQGMMHRHGVDTAIAALQRRYCTKP